MILTPSNISSCLKKKLKSFDFINQNIRSFSSGTGNSGDIRGAGGSFGKKEKAQEEQYFRQKEKEELAQFKKKQEEEKVKKDEPRITKSSDSGSNNKQKP